MLSCNVMYCNGNIPITGNPVQINYHDIGHVNRGPYS
jgi:hypothetical protein